MGTVLGIGDKTGNKRNVISLPGVFGMESDNCYQTASKLTWK